MQKLTEAEKLGEEQARLICHSTNVKSLYSSYVLSLEKYVKDAVIMLRERDRYKLTDNNTKGVLDLLDIVYDRLFDLMDKFYVKVSSYVEDSEGFKEIEALKKSYGKQW